MTYPIPDRSKQIDKAVPIQISQHTYIPYTFCTRPPCRASFYRYSTRVCPPTGALLCYFSTIANVHVIIISVCVYFPSIFFFR